MMCVAVRLKPDGGTNVEDWLRLLFTAAPAVVRYFTDRLKSLSCICPLWCSIR